MADLKAKLEANKFGKFAEEMIVREYTGRGYAILYRNWRMGKTEIDIISQIGDTIVLTEVKARKYEEDALEAVTADKRRRMIRAADAYLSHLNGIFNYRFDIGIMVGNPEEYKLEIIEDAFTSADIF